MAKKGHNRPKKLGPSQPKETTAVVSPCSGCPSFVETKSLHTVMDFGYGRLSLCDRCYRAHQKMREVRHY